MVKKILRKIAPKMMKQIDNFKILAKLYGQFNTIKKWNCIDSDGNKIPWYTYPAIEYLKNIDFNNKIIFEYGSGNSSSFWSTKAKTVISIESNKEWYERVKSGLNENQELLFANVDESYENIIKLQNKKFDVIIIDGMRRVECSKMVEDFVNKESKEGFMVVLDNSDWYRDASKYLREKLDLIEIDFHGFGPINNYTWTTSIFLSRNFKFKPVNNVQPHLSIAGIKQSGEHNE